MTLHDVPSRLVHDLVESEEASADLFAVMDEGRSAGREMVGRHSMEFKGLLDAVKGLCLDWEIQS